MIRETTELTAYSSAHYSRKPVEAGRVELRMDYDWSAQAFSTNQNQPYSTNQNPPFSTYQNQPFSTNQNQPSCSAFLQSSGPSKYIKRAYSKDEKTQDFFALLERMANDRMEDQRCTMPSFLRNQSTDVPNQKDNSAQRESMEAVLSRGPPYPMIVMPPDGGYWIDGVPDYATPDIPHNEDNIAAEPSTSCGRPSGKHKLEQDETAKCYRKHFLGKDHYNFYSWDLNLGPLILSVRCENVIKADHLRIILRTKNTTLHEVVPASCLGGQPTAAKMAKLLCDEVTADVWHAVTFPKKGCDMILNYDEHVLVNQFKFGIIYQQHGQFKEEDLFSNMAHSNNMEEFLNLLGDKVRLNGFTGYRGGLDTQNGQTGQESVYTRYRDKEVMFHVSTMLPYSAGDAQQVQRKRHVGNDIVAIVFQDRPTPFLPSAIASHFLHAYLVVQPAENNCYRVSVACRKDVPFFGPTLPNPAIFPRDASFREFLLTKLLNAENACYRANRFAALAERTRISLLEALYTELKQLSQDFSGIECDLGKSMTGGDSSGKLIESMKKVFVSRNKANAGSVETSASSVCLAKKVIEQPAPVSTVARQSTSSSLFTSSLNRRFTDVPEESPRSSTLARPSTADAISVNATSYKTCYSNPSHESSPDATPPVHKLKSRSVTAIHLDSECSSIESTELEHDSDTGLESMSSAETAHNKRLSGVFFSDTDGGRAMCPKSEEFRKLDEVMRDMANLKHEKMDLLRQNVTCKTDIKKLKERETMLATSLQDAYDEIFRLRQILKTSTVNNSIQENSMETSG